MKEEKGENSYYSFWSFVGITLILLKLNDPLKNLLEYELLFFVVQICLFYLFWKFVIPYMARITEIFCEKTKIPIHYIVILYVIIYILV